MTQLKNEDADYADALAVLQDLNKNAEALRTGDKKARDAVMANCFRLVAALETPGETFMRISWTHCVHPPVIRLASDMGLFDLLQAAEDSGISTHDLAAKASADERLVGRVLKTLASADLVKEVDVDKFAANAFSNAMAEPLYKRALALMIPYASNANQRTPEYLNLRGYKWPDNHLDLPIQFATGDSGKLNTFEIFRRDDQMVGLESLMKVWLDKRPHWSDESAGYYPVRERLVKNAETATDSVFLVDVGGGHGQDFPRLLANIPEAEIPGRLILQDLPDVVGSISEGSLPSKVEVMAYDFYTEQPIKGARTYFMHNIIHNHMDEAAKKILKQIASAMKKGYSKLLLWDHVMPSKGAEKMICCLDWEMLTFYGTSERTETVWRTLLEDPEIGLKVTDIVHYSSYDQDIIELELA